MNKFNKDTIKYYENTFKKFGNNFKGMNWPSKKGQYLRFKELIKIGNTSNKTIHDVGCGNGELLKFFEKKKISFKTYLGSDISKKIINQCKDNYKDIEKVNFETIDILKNKKIKKYDYVFASGIFNIKNNASQKLWKKHVFNIIDKIYRNSKVGCAFNLITPYTTYREKKLFYLSIDELLVFLRKNVSKKIIINHSYDLWEYTVYILKKNK
jgi:SAM-dependent methyltransferase